MGCIFKSFHNITMTLGQWDGEPKVANGKY